jgi:hypothetical protein
LQRVAMDGTARFQAAAARGHAPGVALIRIGPHLLI